MAQRHQFTSSENEELLDRLVYSDFQRRIGSDLNDREKQRLVKTVKHYINQVAIEMPNLSVPLQNKEVLSAVIPDLIHYYNRSLTQSQQQQQSQSQQQQQSQSQQQQQSHDDISTRFSKLQTERNGNKASPPPPPDFRIALDDNSPSAISIFEQVKKAREEEAARGEELIIRTVKADNSFQSSLDQSKKMDLVLLNEREQHKLAVQRDSANEVSTRLITPDPRRIFMNDIINGNQGTSIEQINNNYNSGRNDVNPTLAVPNNYRRGPLPQDNLIKQDDILSYKENEYNLFVYSADRNWFTNKTQNRYNFTVNFDPANNGNGLSYSPSVANKFKNISRIELVKTILPIEGIDIIQTRSVVGNATTYGTSLLTNVLSFPYLNIRIPELDNNNYGTDFNLQQAFGVVQYDANWVSDNNLASKGGFLAMIPKFLKCQKIYQPPTATIQKLTISIQRPDGTLVDDSLDTLDISGFKSSYNMTNCPSANGNITGTSYADTSGNYIWIQTNTWFSRFTVNQGDRIQISNITVPTSYAGNAGAIADFIAFVQRPQGHLVVNIGYTNITPGNSTIYYLDGSNIVGYNNYIVIRSKMKDPTSGNTQPDTFGLLSSSNNQTFLNTLCATALTTGTLINLSHQTTLVFRIITSDLDPKSRLRPDNV